MERRSFLKMSAAAAAAAAVDARFGVAEQAGGAAGVPAGVPAGFNRLTYDYAEFCARPESERVFYALVNGRIVEQRLDEKTWEPTGWGDNPELPLPGGANGSWDGVPMVAPAGLEGLAGTGPYKPEWESLLEYEAPEWYRDAKFGIWAHWSPQCVPEDGDWYGRNMYLPDQAQYKFQQEHYGPPSRFGYKDLCAQWTLLNWEPEALIARYKKAGAKFFIALANHHDGLDAWDSKHQPWNAVNIGPHRDVVGEWARAARAQGLPLGVTVHQGRNWWWFQTAHGADKTGPLAGVPYDGRMTMPEGKGRWWQGYDPQRLYGVKHPKDALPDVSYVKNFYDRTRDLIDQHHPDLLYFDNSLFPLGWGGMNLGAYYYNQSAAKNGGKADVVVTIKDVPEKWAKAVVVDYERGLTSAIMPHAWQSETCIGQWHYDRALYEKPGEYGGYLAPRDVIHWMADTVSKNGTFILNVPGRPDGTIDAKEIAVLDGITQWMEVNGEAIYATRPWKVYGEGPNMIKPGKFQGQSVTALGEKDIRFTRNKAGDTVYAIVLGWPAGEIVIESLGTGNAAQPGKVANVELLGSGERVRWRQEASAMRVELPKQYRPAVSDTSGGSDRSGAYAAAVLKVRMA
jgi:alpha-L-fucosidase